MDIFSKFLLHREAHDQDFFNFPGMLSLPEGRGKATPTFGKN